MPRKNFLNENYFDVIDTEDKAYFLGFLFADGCISKSQWNYLIVLSLQEGDKYILEHFNKQLDSSYPLRRQSPRKPTRQAQFSLHLSSKKLFERLNDLGCVPKKSLILKFPERIISNHLISHFIRGYFDGDGSIFIYKRPKNGHIRYNLSVISSTIFINGFLKFIGYGRVETCKNDKNSAWLPAGKENLMKFINFIYEDASIFLKRKREKSLEVIKHITRND